MIRINLLPPEILEKRRDEARWRWVILGGVVAFAVLLIFYTVMFFQVTVRQGEVAGVEQEGAQLQAQTEQVQIFQEQEEDLEVRKKLAEKAMVGKVDWARLFYEISLIMPSNAFLLNLSGLEDDPLTTLAPGAIAEEGQVTNESLLSLTGNVTDPDVLPDTSYKELAQLLVRLGELDQLHRVWLANASKTMVEQDQSDPLIPSRPPYTAFSIEAQFPETKPPVEEDAAAVPAPPAPAP